MTRGAVNGRGSRAHVTEIVATGHSYPSDVVDNDAFFARARFPVARDAAERAALVESTRMKTRTWCADGENTWTMAREAVRMALAASPVPASEIDLVLVSSCSTIPRVNYPDPENPVVADLAPLVLAELGRDDATGIDVKATYCAGFIRCLEMMDAMLASPSYRAGLIVATDQGGLFATAESNRSAFCFLVGDAAGAMIVRKAAPGPRVGVVDCVGRTIPSKARLTSWGADGRSLLVRGAGAQAATLELLEECGRTLLERNGLRPSDVDWVVPMQTHVATVEAFADAVALPREKVLWRGDETGYAASASIPACLSVHVERGVVRRGDLVLAVAVGAGMNCAGALFHA